MLTRRALLKSAGAGVVGLALPNLSGLSTRAAAVGQATAGVPFYYCFVPRASQVAVTSFVAELPIPPTLQPFRSDANTDHYRLTMRAASATIIPGLSTPIYGYDGLFPGPTIRATRGRQVSVQQVNTLPMDTVVHLHGAHTRPADDGHPVDVIPSGASRFYHYPNHQQAATLWYHDHTLMHTGANVYRGLAGMYVLSDEMEAALDLPRDEQDIPLVLADRIFNADGSFYYPTGHSDGVLGDIQLVNGAPFPRATVATRLYRFRILNASNCRVYSLSFADGRPFTQIATDAGLLPAPVTRSAIDLAPAERVEVVVDFTADPVGTTVVLRNDYGTGQAAQIMRFDVLRAEPETVTLPSVLRPIVPPGDPVTTRTMALSFDPVQGWLINGKPFDASRVDASPVLGTTEVWVFANLSGLAHAMHVHLVSFLILDRDGVPPEPGEAGWKDTVLVHAGETVRVIATFAHYPGRFVFHCHNLEHEDHDMMNQFEVVLPTSP